MEPMPRFGHDYAWPRDSVALFTSHASCPPSRFVVVRSRCPARRQDAGKAPDRKASARPPPLVPLGTLLYGERGTKRMLEYVRLAMGFANVRASRNGIRLCSGGYSSTNAGAGAGQARRQAGGIRRRVGMSPGDESLRRFKHFMYRCKVRRAATPVQWLCSSFSLR